MLWLAKGKDGAVTQLFLWHTTVWWQQKCTRYWTVQTFKRNIRWIDNLIAVVAQNKTVEVKCRYLCFYYIPFIISKWLFFILSKNIMGLHCRNFCSAVTFCIFSFYPSDLENLTKKAEKANIYCNFQRQNSVFVQCFLLQAMELIYTKVFGATVRRKQFFDTN